jgi:hypothetical protein
MLVSPNFQIEALSLNLLVSVEKRYRLAYAKISRIRVALFGLFWVVSIAI